MKDVIRKILLGVLFIIATLSFFAFWNDEFHTWFWQLVVMILVPIIYLMDRKIYRLKIKQKYIKPL